MSAIIRREVFQGAVEGFSLPDGSFVVALHEASVLTGTANLQNPAAPAIRQRVAAPEPVRYPVLTVGTGRGRCIAAQAAPDESRATWEWVEADLKWYDRGPDGGERPCVYLPDGTLIIESGGPNHPTEGWAGTDLNGVPMRIVRYDVSRELHEVTVAGPFAIGQNSLDNGGVELQFDGKKYQVEPGDAHTIWAVLGANGVLAVTTRKLAQNETVCLWVDVNRIAELPPAPTKPPTVIPPIEPPKGDKMHVPNRAALLAQFHQEYNGGQRITELDDKHRFTKAFVPWLNAHEPDADAKGRYARKSRESSPDIVSKDTIAFWLGAKPLPTENTNGQIDAVDIIDSSGNVGWDTRAEQDDPGYHDIRALWMPVSGGVVIPPIEPPKDDALAARVTALEAWKAGVIATLAEGAAVNTRQWEAIQALENKPPGGAGGIQPGDLIVIENQTSTGSTALAGGVFRHSHSHSRILGTIARPTAAQQRAISDAGDQD